MSVAVVADNDFAEKVLKSQIPVFVDFWARWCAPCKISEPVIEELSEEHQGKVLFLKIDVDENQRTAQEYKVMSIPTTIIFKGGKEVARQTGFSGKQAYVNLLEKA